MIFLGEPRVASEGTNDWVVYHTGATPNDAGTVKKVRLAVLDQHPDKRWRPIATNPNFLGFLSFENSQPASHAGGMSVYRSTCNFVVNQSTYGYSRLRGDHRGSIFCCRPAHTSAAETNQFLHNDRHHPVETKPFFSLSTNRTFGTSENPRLWLDHRSIDSLDFRVYRINDPRQFFTQLSNPHQMGEDESEQVTTNLSAKRSLLERIRGVKVWAYSGIRNYFRENLKQNTRRTINQKFRATETSKRVPLNVADYARVPLLNSNQLVTSWREQLPQLENQYDQRTIPLGKRESGVYLVEAIGGELRAYTIVVVTDLAMVEKLSPSGELLVYAVDRKSGEPRADTRVEIVRERATIASGRTDNEGIFRAKIPTQSDDTDPTGEEVSNSNFVILGSQQDNFAISDLESFYFRNFGEQSENVQGYIYTDRPVYRPNHKVFFKGILRGYEVHRQYRAIKGDKVFVSVKDPTMREFLNSSSNSRNVEHSAVNLHFRKKRPSELTASRLRLMKAVQLALLTSRSTRNLNTKSALPRRKHLHRKEARQNSISMPDTSSAHRSQAQKLGITSIALVITHTSMRTKSPRKTPMKLRNIHTTKTTTATSYRGRRKAQFFRSSTS